MYSFSRLAGLNFNFCTELSTETVDKINSIDLHVEEVSRVLEVLSIGGFPDWPLSRVFIRY